MKAEALTLTLHLFSQHFDGDDRWNERNWGVGLNRSGVHAGVFRNSLYRTSIYLGRSHMWCLEWVCGGAAIVAVTGYDPDIVVATVPMISIGREFRLQMIASPRMAGSPGFIGGGVELPLGGWR